MTKRSCVKIIKTVLRAVVLPQNRPLGKPHDPPSPQSGADYLAIRCLLQCDQVLITV